MTTIPDQECTRCGIMTEVYVQHTSYSPVLGKQVTTLCSDCVCAFVSFAITTKIIDSKEFEQFATETKP